MLTNVKCMRDTLTFTLCGSDAKTAKRLRETIMFIPTFAIHDVRIKQCMENEEMLAHALGLIPVVYRRGTNVPSDPLFGFRFTEDCACLGQRCPQCAILFTCDVQTDRMVYSHDFKSAQPADLLPDVAICRGPLVVAAFAVLGSKGAKHACAAPLPYYTHPVHVRLHPERKLTPVQKRDLVACCPSKVFEMGDMEDLYVNPTRTCIGCNECVKKGLDFRDAETDPDLVSIEYEKSTFEFVVESAGQLRPDTIWLYIQRYFKL